MPTAFVAEVDDSIESAESRFECMVTSPAVPHVRSAPYDASKVTTEFSTEIRNLNGSYFGALGDYIISTNGKGVTLSAATVQAGTASCRMIACTFHRLFSEITRNY